MHVIDRAELKMVGILNYFKYKCDIAASYSTSLPQPDGSLKKKVPSKVIELAKAEVKKVI